MGHLGPPTQITILARLVQRIRRALLSLSATIERRIDAPFRTLTIQILHRLFYGIAFTWNCLLVTSLKGDPNGDVPIFKESSNELEYVLKRRQGGNMNQESPVEPDSKERRSSMGSSFIRFGRDESNNLDNTDSKVNRYPRWKSPDIVIRFGRADLKSLLDYKRARSDLNFIRFGRSDVGLSTICSDMLSFNEDPYKMRLCEIFNGIDTKQE